MAVQVETKSVDDTGYYTKRAKAQKVDFAKVKEILQRNVTKNVSKTFTQYTKDLVKTYVQSPNANQDTIREISRFICRNSMIYQKLLMYHAAMPLFNYNITPINSMVDNIDANKTLKSYEKVLKEFESFKLKKEGYTALYMGARDGIYVGYVYNNGEDGKFVMPLDVQYCRIFGKNEAGEWIVYFNAAFFDSRNNLEFVEGESTWDKVFVDGYKKYDNDGKDFQWFMLPPENLFVLMTSPEDEFAYPLPFYLPLFVSLLDLLDLEQILQSKTELENYKLIVSKIPLISNSDDVDDFAISLELAKMFNELLDIAAPDLVGTVYSPMDIDVVNFENSNKSNEIDSLGISIQNLFNNAGSTQLVVAGGKSTSVTALKHALQNDTSITWVWVNRIESWLNYFIKNNISEGYILQIHQQTWYNRDEYISEKKDAATLGGSAMDYLTSLGDTPYVAYQKIKFENAIGIKSLMVPLQSSYTQSSAGAPRKNVDDLSDEGARNLDKPSNGEE